MDPTGVAQDAMGNVLDENGNIISDPSSVNPAVAMADPSPSTNGGLISTLEGWAGSATSSVESVASAAGRDAVSGVKALATGGKNFAVSAVQTAEQVGSGALNKVESVVSFGTTQILILVLGLGLALYLVGKGGLRVN